MCSKADASSDQYQMKSVKTAKSTANVIMKDPAVTWSAILVLEDLSGWAGTGHWVYPGHRVS